MANLTSLKLYGLPCPYDRYQDFISMFTTCLQQSSIERLNLSCIYNFPLSVLDNSETIKKLTLFDFTARKEISSSPPSQQSLETLIIAIGDHPDIYLWALRRVAHLTSLELRFWWMDHQSSTLPGVLTACSNSLTSLRLGIEYYTSTWIYNTDHHMCRWINDGPQFPFALSALAHLKSLAIFSAIDINTIGIECALPEIIRIIKTAPAIQYIVLDFHCEGQACIESLGRLDWSLIDCLHTHPGLELCFTGEGVAGCSIPPETILDALAANEALMVLVKRGLVVLKSEPWLKEDP